MPSQGLGKPDVKLGQPISSLSSGKIQRAQSLSKSRYFDDLWINTYVYVGRGMLIETINCSGGDELIVGIRSGGGSENLSALRKKPLEQWRAEQEIDLQKSGVQIVRHRWEGHSQWLWGIKSGSEIMAESVADYRILGRKCFRGPSTTLPVCDMSSWQVHDVRSKAISGR